MGVLDSYSKFLIKREKLKKICALKKKCYFIFSDRCSIEEMQNIVEYDWNELLKLFPIYINYSDIAINFVELKNGYINRNEYALKVQYICELVEEETYKLKKETEKLAADFSNSYNSFFTDGERKAKNCSTELIYHVLRQPEAKAIIMEFLKQ